jgi:hypothetical protein
VAKLEAAIREAIGRGARRQVRVVVTPLRRERRAGPVAPRRHSDDHGLHTTHATGHPAGFGNARRRGGVKKGFTSLPQGNETSGRITPQNHRGGPNGIRLYCGRRLSRDPWDLMRFLFGLTITVARDPSWRVGVTPVYREAAEK